MASIEPICGHNDRVDLKSILPLKTPFTLNVFPTNACNFKCHYCAQVLGVKKLKEQFDYHSSHHMTMSTFEKIVEQSLKFNTPYKLLSFMGHGEPLLNKQLPKMIKLASKHKIAQRIEILTNGALLTNELSDALIDAGVTNIRVSLQGLTAKKYLDTARVKVDFEQYLKNLEYFHQQSFSQGSNLFVKILDCSLDKNEEKVFYKMFNNISSRMYIESVKPVYEGVEFTQNLDGTSTDRYGNIHSPRIVCPLAFFTLAIWPNGDITPCDAIYKPTTLGNVNHKDISKIFIGKQVNKFRLEHLNGKKNSLFGCNKCCAPDDVSHEKDELDSSRQTLLIKYLKI